MTNQETSPNQKFLITNDDVKAAGCVSYWRMSGQTSLRALDLAWAKAGFSGALLPAEVSPAIALSRAVRAQESATVRAFKIKGGVGNNDFAGGWGLAEVDTTDGHVRTNEMIRVRWNKDTGAIETDGDLFRASRASEIRTAFAMARSALAPADVSAWLVDLAGKQNAVSLRESGGVYFIPRPAMDFWTKVSEIVESVGDHDVLRIPALHNDEAVAAIVDAITREAAAAAEALDAALDAHAAETNAEAGALGLKALKTQGKNADALLQKVQSYEELLGVRLVEVVAKVNAMTSKIASAADTRKAAVNSVSERLGVGVAIAALSA